MISFSKLKMYFLELQAQGANNINLVTPSHYVFQIIEAIEMAKKDGLMLPVVYNSSAYGKVGTLKALEGYVGVYLAEWEEMDDNVMTIEEAEERFGIKIIAC